MHYSGDNDGWKDLLIAQGHDLDTIELTSPNLRYREPMLLAKNTGHGFLDVSADAGSVFREAWVGRGMAIGDMDNDGRLDAVVTTNDEPLYVLHNVTVTTNHWLILKLVGHKSNRDAIGAEVRVTTVRGFQLQTVTKRGIVTEGMLRFMDQQRRNNFYFFQDCSGDRGHTNGLHSFRKSRHPRTRRPNRKTRQGNLWFGRIPLDALDV